MNRAELLEKLVMVERHVTEGAENIARQHERIAVADRAGGDTSLLREVLKTCADSQTLHVADRAGVLAKLGA